MKKLKYLTVAIAIGLILNSCSNNKTEEKSEKTTEVQTEKTTVPITRPAKSDESTSKILGKFDSKVASIMKTLRKMKKSMKNDGTKITPTAEKNISAMFNEANELASQLKIVSDKLSEDDYGLYERDQERLRDKETDFETIKQNK